MARRRQFPISKGASEADRHAFAAALLLCLTLLTGCSGASDGAGTNTMPFAGCSATTCAVPAGLNQAMVFIEPRDREKPIVQAIAGAKHSVWVEVYLLTDYAVIHALEDAANRHVDVRVLLEVHPFGGGNVSAQKTIDSLNLTGVKAKPADPAFAYTHAKTILVDGSTLLVMT